MRWWVYWSAVLAAVLVLTVAVAADENAETYGKSDADILALGQDDWLTFYTSQAGDSTADMAAALAVYQAAAKRRDEALPQGAFNVGELRRLLGDYASHATDLSYNMAGGGTMWTLVGAGAACDIEDILYAILGGHMAPAPPMTTGAVRRSFSALHQRMQAVHHDPDATYFHYGEAQTDFAALRADFDTIVKSAGTLDRSDSDRVLQFCDRLIGTEDLP